MLLWRGWRCWYDDGSVYNSVDHSWTDLPDDGLLVKMLYYEGGGKQIQQGTKWYFEAPHHSGEIVRGTGNDRKDIEARYPGAVIVRGKWGPDDYYARIVDEAMRSTWP